MPALSQKESVRVADVFDASRESAPAQERSTRLLSDYIKGVCILVVCWHHLIYNNFPNEFSFLGHQFVVYFFILSGYGIFKSIHSDRTGDKGFSWLIRYILKRSLRIYPIYWLWVCVPYNWEKVTSLDFFLLSLNAPPVWFLNAIVYCYLAAPVLYFITSRMGFFSIALYAGFFMFLAAVLDYFHVSPVLGLAYCKVYFSYVFTFGCGMALARPCNVRMSRALYYLVMILLALLFLVSALQVSMYSMQAIDVPQIRLYYFPVNPYVFLFFFSSISLMFLALNGSPCMPFSALLLPFGKCSLSIYLFHVYYIDAIMLMLGLGRSILCYFVAFIVFLPVLLAGCRLIEAAVEKISGNIISRV